MIKDYEYLRRTEKFEKKIRIACDFHSAKYEFTQGRIPILRKQSILLTM